MREIILTALLLGVAFTGLATSASASTVTVHLVVHTDVGDERGWDPQADSEFPGTAACEVVVPAGASGGAVLDQATLDGCILGWTESPVFPGFVETVDGVHAVFATWFVMSEGQWWQFHLNGDLASFGIHEYEAQDGDTMEWFYESGEL